MPSKSLSIGKPSKIPDREAGSDLNSKFSLLYNFQGIKAPNSAQCRTLEITVTQLQIKLGEGRIGFDLMSLIPN